ncbi:MAG TPA: 30S ribosome-binding factor RbfA [Actinobacteria bacterium]|nr:ribosome-binding factor A [bacterium BMS3Bbin02]HDL42009.1 30S ribosome-binding factor RbfA [Actinomycetota bacterium]
MSKSPTPRIRKVNGLVQEIVAEAVAELIDPELGFVTITGVDCSPDLRKAVVYFSPLGTAEERKASGDALERATKRVQAEVARQVRMKFTPVIEFAVDTAVENGMRITRILGEIETEESDQGVTQ